jgi:hypothetical protein
MKKITQSTTNGGAPINLGDLKGPFNDEIWDAIEALLSTFVAEGIIVSGCLITGSGPYDISAGIVCLGGEFMRFPGATGQTLPKYIVPDTAVNDDRVFSDATTKTLFITKSATLSASPDGGAANRTINITTVTDPDSRRMGNFYINKAEGDVMNGNLEVQGGIRTQNSGPFLKNKVLEIVDWNMNTSVAGSSTKDVPHGLSDHTKIRIIGDPIIRNDSGTIFALTSEEVTLEGGLRLQPIDATNIKLYVSGGGSFDNNAFDSTGGYVRGWIPIWYEA